MKYIVLTLSAVFLIGCGGNKTFQTKNGTLVSYAKKGKEAPSDTLVSYFLLKYQKEGGKVFYETEKNTPTPIKLDSNFFKNQGTFFEVIGEMKIGDSLYYTLPAQELFVENFKGRLPDSVLAEDPINVTVSFLEQVTMDDYQQKSLAMKREQMLAQVDTAQVAKDVAIIDAYLTEKGIEAVKLDCGIRYVVTEAGAGEKMKLGQQVKVNYAGYLLTGEYFDTSMEDRAKANGLYNENRPYTPYPINVYASAVITGWHEGIYQLNMGDKATLYLPSSYGYGPRGSGAVIKPNDVLVFDVELSE